MNRITLYFLLLFAACKNEAETFTVSGVIGNAPAKTVVLQQLSFNNPQAVVSDSSTIDAKGMYELNGSRKEEGLYVLSLNNQPAVIFVNDGANIQISFDIQKFTKPDVKGSPATESLYQFIHSYMQKDSALAAVYADLDALIASGSASTDSGKAVLQQKGLQQMAAMNKYITDFISKSESPATICFALDKARQSMTIQEIDALVKKASGRFANHAGILYFKNAIAFQLAEENSAGNYDLLNQQAPDLTMKTPAGESLSISSYKGKFLLVDFWASWCGPCRQENPNLVAAYKQYHSDKFEILGVSLDKSDVAWKQAITKDNLTWPQMSDLKQWDSEAVSAYHFDGIPFNVLINPEGKIVAHNLRGPQLEETLQKYLK